MTPFILTSLGANDLGFVLYFFASFVVEVDGFCIRSRSRSRSGSDGINGSDLSVVVELLASDDNIS